MSDELNSFIWIHWTADRVSFEQVKRSSGWVVSQDLGVAWVGRVGGSVSLFDPSFLADKFKRIP